MPSIGFSNAPGYIGVKKKAFSIRRVAMLQCSEAGSLEGPLNLNDARPGYDKAVASFGPYLRRLRGEALVASEGSISTYVRD